eukprot:scaffold74678_cov30-Attheya_sp.AAC.1
MDLGRETDRLRVCVPEAICGGLTITSGGSLFDLFDVLLGAPATDNALDDDHPTDMAFGVVVLLLLLPLERCVVVAVAALLSAVRSRPIPELGALRNSGISSVVLCTGGGGGTRMGSRSAAARLVVVAVDTLTLGIVKGSKVGGGGSGVRAFVVVVVVVEWTVDEMEIMDKESELRSDTMGGGSTCRLSCASPSILSPLPSYLYQHSMLPSQECCCEDKEAVRGVSLLTKSTQRDQQCFLACRPPLIAQDEGE